MIPIRADIVHLEVDYEKIQKAKRLLEAQIGEQLKDRGEAHITILSPQEVKLAGVSTKEIVEAFWQDILKAEWSADWVGKASDGTSTTYFFIVDSPDLILVREHIKERFGIDKMGVLDQDLHITIGYTVRDVFPPRGHKGLRSRTCLLSLGSL